MRTIDVDPSNVDSRGFFCSMSKKRSAGYQRKLKWLKERFSEGLRIKLLELPDRGFIEYIPGEHAWRAVNANGYMFVHCLWVVGKSKGKGYGAALLDECVRDAQQANMKGVAMVASEGAWLVGKRLLQTQGFECVGEAPPSFFLMVKRFGDGPLPSFADNRSTTRHRFGNGLTVIRSDQCPYIEDATRIAVDSARKAGIKSRVVELQSADEVRRLSPSAYGAFGIVLNGQLLSYLYLLEKDLLPLLKA